MLQKQLIALDFTQGVDTKNDEKLSAKPSRLENSGPDQQGTLAKLGGYSQLSAPVGSAERLTALGLELLVQSLGVLYSVGTSSAISKGFAPRWSSTKRQVVRGTATQSGFDVGYASAVEVHVWQDSRGGLRATVRDMDRGATYIDDESFSSTGILPRCITSGDIVYVVYIEGTDLKLRTLNANSPTAFSAAVTIVAAGVANTAQQMDAVLANNSLYIAYRGIANDLQLRRTDLSGVVQNSASVAENPNRGLGIFWMTTNSRLAVFTQGSGTGDLNYRVYTSTLGLHAGPTVVHAGGVLVFPRITGFSFGAGGYVFYEVTAASTQNTYVRRATVLDDGTISSAAADFLRSVGLASAPFDTGGDQLIAVTHEPPSTTGLQPTVFVARAGQGTPSGVIVGRCVAGFGGGLLTAARCPNVPNRGEVHYLPVNERGRLTIETDDGGSTVVDMTPEGITVMELTKAAPLQALEVGDILFMCGASPSIYDGKSVVEAGFHLFPEGVSVTGVVGGGVLTAGAYQCTAVYEWTDARGQRWQSAAAPPVSVTVGANDQITWTLPTLRLTLKKTDRANVRIVPYRTEANGSIFYRVALPDAAPENSTTADTVSFTDNALSDANLVSREPLYTTGGVFDNGPIPPCRAACEHEGRLVLAGCESPDTIAVSQEKRELDGWEFNESLVYRVPEGGQAGGDVSAVGSMDGRLLVFREGCGFAYLGELPNRAGVGGTFGVPQVVAPDAGCTDLRTLLELPDGLARMTRKGLYLLTRQLQDVYFGADVEDYNSESFVGAVALKTQGQARWYTAGGSCLLWSWERNQWSVLTNHSAAGVTEWQDTVRHVTSGGVIHTAGGNTHNGSAISQVVVTPWLKLGGIAGFQRVWRMFLTGQTYGTCTITVEAAFDYSSTYTETWTFTAGASEAPLAIRHHMATQKCAAVRFRITETGGGSGQGMRLTNLMLEVGLKKGGRKLPAAQTV